MYTDPEPIARMDSPRKAEKFIERVFGEDAPTVGRTSAEFGQPSGDNFKRNRRPNDRVDWLGTMGTNARGHGARARGFSPLRCVRARPSSMADGRTTHRLSCL